MISASLVLSAVLVGLLVGQGIALCLFGRQFYVAVPRQNLSDGHQKITTVMPVRGGGRRLRQAIQSLVNQTYSNATLLIVVDSVQDPAFSIACDTIKNFPEERVRVTVLHDRRPHCGMVCSSLLQSLSECDDDTEIITFAAADTVLPCGWLEEIESVLSRPDVGATLGNRWYRPGNNAGSLVLFLWNAGATIPMWLYQIPWAGALGLRCRDLEPTGLLEIWQRTIVEDTPVMLAMKNQNKKMAYSPQLIVPVDEEMDLRGCIEFISRQLLWTRLYHPCWCHVAAAAVSGALAVWLPFLLGLLAAVFQNFQLSGFFLAMGCLYVLGLFVFVIVLNRFVNRSLVNRGEPEVSLGISTLCKLLVLIPVAQIVSLVGICFVMFRRQVWWSGIRYRIDSSGKVTWDDLSDKTIGQMSKG